MKKLSFIIFLLIAFTALADRGVVTLRWEPLAGATNYKVYCGYNTNRLTLMVTNTPATQITLSNMTRRPWFFLLTSVNTLGQETEVPIASANVITSLGRTNISIRTRVSVFGTYSNAFPVVPTNQTLEFKR